MWPPRQEKANLSPGTTSSTWQRIVPSHSPAGVVWKVKRLPSTGSKPLGAISQRAISAPLVSARQTLPGECGSTSSIAMSRVRGLSGIWFISHLLEKGVELGEALAPEAGIVAHPVGQRGQPARIGAVVDLAPLGPLGDEAGQAERLEVLRDRALRHPAAARELGHGDFVTPRDALEHRPPGGIGERTHDGVEGGGLDHAAMISDC